MDGQLIHILVTQGALVRVITWPASVHLAGGLAATATALKADLYTLVWVASASAWYEMARALAL